MAERPWGFESPLAHTKRENGRGPISRKRPQRPDQGRSGGRGGGYSRQSPRSDARSGGGAAKVPARSSADGRSRGRQPRSSRRSTLPPLVTLVGAAFLLLLALAFIFFVGRGFLANQEATQVRKYVMSSNDLLVDSSNLGREKLQPLIQSAGGDPAQLDPQAMDQIVEEAQRLHQLSMENSEVPQEFDGAHSYLESTLGIRASATEGLRQAASGDPGTFNEALATAVEDYRTSDSVAINHYFPSSRSAIEQAGQQEDEKYLEEPRPFMDYGELGFDSAAIGTSQVRADPNALHGVEIGNVTVAGQQLFQGGTVVLSGSAEPVFAVTVVNGGEVAENNVPVEVVLNTQAGRQSNSQNIQQIEPGGTATVEVGGFRPGELNETAEATVEAGPVEYEDLLDNNTLTGRITFGL